MTARCLDICLNIIKICDMKADERRNRILNDIKNAKSPVSASRLASRYKVSRQIVVGDVALLRAGGEDIYATPRGYVIEHAASGITHTVACIHTSNKDMQDEMNIMVDNGCTIVNVIVEHPVYGQLVGQLACSSRHDVQEFLRKVTSADAAPLSELTNGLHLHTLICPDEEAFARVQEQLREHGYLYES